MLNTYKENEHILQNISPQIPQISNFSVCEQKLHFS